MVGSEFTFGKMLITENDVKALPTLIIQIKVCCCCCLHLVSVITLYMNVHSSFFPFPICRHTMESTSHSIPAAYPTWQEIATHPIHSTPSWPFQPRTIWNITLAQALIVRKSRWIARLGPSSVSMPCRDMRSSMIWRRIVLDLRNHTTVDRNWAPLGWSMTICECHYRLF